MTSIFTKYETLGRLARSQGRPLEDNPYRVGSFAAQLWREAWLAEDSKLRLLA